MKLIKISETPSPLFDNRGDSSYVGDRTEYEAILWLLKNNFKVFKNCECTGPADLSVVSQNGSTLLVDVKTNYRPSGRTDIQKKLGVVYLVRKKYGEFHFVKHREIKNA